MRRTKKTSNNYIMSQCRTQSKKCLRAWPPLALFPIRHHTHHGIKISRLIRYRGTSPVPTNRGPLARKNSHLLAPMCPKIASRTVNPRRLIQNQVPTPRRPTLSRTNQDQRRLPRRARSLINHPPTPNVDPKAPTRRHKRQQTLLSRRDGNHKTTQRTSSSPRSNRLGIHQLPPPTSRKHSILQAQCCHLKNKRTNLRTARKPKRDKNTEFASAG